MQNIIDMLKMDDDDQTTEHMINDIQQLFKNTLIPAHQMEELKNEVDDLRENYNKIEKL